MKAKVPQRENRKMKLSDAIRNRHACRAFLDREVEADKIERILLLAARAPSGYNLQPWKIAVVSGRTKQAIAEELETQKLSG